MAHDSTTSPPAQTPPLAEGVCPDCARTPGPTPPRLLGLKAGAAYLSVSDWTLRELLWRGELPFIEVGAPGSLRPRRLVDLYDLDEWIERRKQRHSLPPDPRPRERGRRG